MNHCLSVTDLKILAVYAVFTQLVVAISTQNCSDTVGFLDRDNGKLLTQNQTYLLADQQYTVPCKGKVIAWEFCYLAQARHTNVSLYVGIWRMIDATDHSGSITYVQVNSNVIAFVPDGRSYTCQRFNLSVKHQFIAPAGSIVGLYSNLGPMFSLLLYTNSNDITGYMFNGNRKNITINANDKMFDSRISIKLHLDIQMTVPSDSGTSNHNATGIIIGTLFGFIIFLIFVILLLLFLVQKWKQKKGGKRNSDFDTTSQEYFELETRHSVELTDQAALLSSEYSNINYKSTQPVSMLFLEENSIDNNSPKLACNVTNYSALQNPPNYATAQEVYSNLEKSFTYDYARALECSEVSTNIEEIYLDPGHSKADIYACFERKKFRIIKNRDVSILQKIGSGEFGTVHHGLWASDTAIDPIEVAVKTLNSECSESDKVKFLREAAIMGQFEDDNIVKLHGVVTEVPNAMIVLELMPKGDLREFLVDLKEIYSVYPEELTQLKQSLLNSCRHISAGLNHLSYKGFVHRDLAARNILVSSDDVCKIADFGMARDVADDSYYIIKGGKIPVKWTPPEVRALSFVSQSCVNVCDFVYTRKPAYIHSVTPKAIFYRRYSVQSDVWSYGCVMYEIWSLGHKPFEDDDGREYINKISAGYRLPPPPGCPRAVYELMIQCWHPIANHRISSNEIVRTLSSDRILLSSTDEEQSTVLGDPLDTSSHLYLDLQQTYLSDNI